MRVFVPLQEKINRQALDTVYELVWESEFKNILNVGRIWLKLRTTTRQQQTIWNTFKGK